MQRRATHTAVTEYISTLLPVKFNDVSRLYHVPRNPRYNPDTAGVDRVVLTVTPSPGVYNLIGHPSSSANSDSDASSLTDQHRTPRTICFLHRPFSLERRRVRHGTLAISSHTSFDEHLTVGWNTVLADRLGVDVSKSACIQGYKGDAERKIGIVGNVSMLTSLLLRRIRQEFGHVEFVHEGRGDEIKVVAIMNAFHAEDVHRVLEVAQENRWLSSDDASSEQILYLTGQPRETGLLAAREMGMSVVCVGHRTAEEWGIRYMASSIRLAFPNLEVKELYEEETTSSRRSSQ
ncbi:hypothetical protein BS50DRAFT_571536 [Corynespora cassiicola Philippines]|uniref:NGG1p interacting factor 3 n=1 Tax=Corynespora cassiicola Philippines TaxID=1448308 RepID=A0A2T2NXU8_CORCC|nr:hypothetical protein BS50DRAFT_571536 [Corynespora cassiicola Philippines]